MIIIDTLLNCIFEDVHVTPLHVIILNKVNFPVLLGFIVFSIKVLGGKTTQVSQFNIEIILPFIAKHSQHYSVCPGNFSFLGINSFFQCCWSFFMLG